MPTATQKVVLRWPAVPYAANGSVPTTSAKPPPVDNAQQAAYETPSTIPEPKFETVTVVPADQIPPAPTHQSIQRYENSGSTILQGYCAEPAYTILDGPTALWVPVVGCISSKSDCCPTPTTDGGSNPAITGGGSGGSGGGGGNPSSGGDNPGAGIGGAGGGAQFPISFMPTQGTLTGCPKDYHTVGGTACCPSSYWLWSTELGGQVPCYSSLATPRVPPPIPNTLVDGGDVDVTGTITSFTSTRPTALTMTQKPTLAIVNIAYAMQYAVVPPPKPELKTDAKIGIGVGVSGAAVLMGVMAWFLVRRVFARNKTNRSVQNVSASQRFGSQIDMSRVANDPASAERNFGGARYFGVSTR